MNNQPQMKIDFSQTVAVACEECGNDTFRHVFKMRKLSALLSPTGESAMVPLEAFACDKCGHINKDFMPKTK